jgi:hypothetical protein
VAGLLLGLPGQLLSWFKLLDPVTGFFEIGVDIMKGLWEGIKSMKNWIEDKIKGLAGGVVDKAKDFFGVGSPSTVFRAIGQSLADGLGLGLADGLRNISPSVQASLATNIMPAQVPVGGAAGIGGRSLTNYGRIVNVYGPGRKSIDVIRDLDRMV